MQRLDLHTSPFTNTLQMHLESKGEFNCVLLSQRAPFLHLWSSYSRHSRRPLISFSFENLKRDRWICKLIWAFGSVSPEILPFHFHDKNFYWQISVRSLNTDCGEAEINISLAFCLHSKFLRRGILFRAKECLLTPSRTAVLGCCHFI